MLNELNGKYDKDKQLLNEIMNQKKDLNETLINLEKQVRLLNRTMSILNYHNDLYV